MKPLRSLSLALLALAHAAAACGTANAPIVCKNDEECLVGQFCDRASRTCRERKADTGVAPAADAAVQLPPDGGGRPDGGRCTTLLCSGVCCGERERCVGGQCVPDDPPDAGL